MEIDLKTAGTQEPSIVKNQYGAELDLTAAAMIMDTDLTNSPKLSEATTDQEWYEIYCRLHAEKFGEEFEPDKLNGQW